MGTTYLPGNSATGRQLDNSQQDDHQMQGSDEAER
jgi:hypothetical protein